MSDADTVSEEVVVYGDAAEEESSTDVISIPADFYTFYLPAGPTIINPPFPPGGGGGDVDPKEEFEEAATKATWIAAGFGLMALVPGVGQAAVIGFGVAAIGFGLAAYHLGDAAGDPPQHDFEHPAGSRLTKRSVRQTGDKAVDRAVARAIGVEQTTATFVDAAELLQGAFMAGSAEWTQRHAESAGDAYAAAGGAIVHLVDALPAALKPMQAHPRGGAPAPPGMPGPVDKLLNLAAPFLDLTSDDQAAARSVLGPSLGRGIPTNAELNDGVTTLQRLGRRLLDAWMVDTQFRFVKERPAA